MSNSIGQVALDFILNKDPFNRDLKSINAQAQQASNKISNSFKKIGLAVAGAFSVKAIVKFGKECVKLGSDLAEVQNVVDVTFTKMSDKVNNFAKNAMTSYGLSETIAKKFTGTFGAMAKSYGFTEQQSYDMATALTGLAGDVASFYNLSQDEAYTKLKSVFTGETESLKDLGVVMTQTALDSYALANGFGKTTSAMTEAEKVSLRYSFVQQQLAGAQGDFARTSDSWANQVRVLQLRFDSLKATIGQGLINALTPVIKLLNNLLAGLSVVAEKFKAFTEQVFGFTSSGSGATDSMTTISEGATNSSQALDKVTDSAEKAKRSVAGFDKLNVLSKPETLNTSNIANSINPVISATSIISADETGSKTTSSLQKFFNNLYENSGFKGFVSKVQQGINKVDWSSIRNNCMSALRSSLPIAKASLKGTQKIAESAFSAMGSVASGMITTTGKNVQTISGGISKWLERDNLKIVGFINTVSNNFSKGFNNVGNFADKWFSIVGQSIDNVRPEMETAISDFMSGLTDFGGAIGVMFSDSFSIASGSLVKWVDKDGAEILSFLENLQTMLGDVLTLIGDVFSDMGNIITDWWDSDGANSLQSICDMFTNIGTTLMNVWNDWIKPAWDFIVSALQSAWDECLKPVFDSLLSFFGKLGECVSAIWNNFLSPIVNWLVDVFGPVFTNIFNAVGAVFSTVFTLIGDVVSGILDALGGLLDFITGIFTGNWEKAWQGICDFFAGIWQAIWGIIKGVINLIIDAVNLLWTAIYTVIGFIVNALGGLVKGLGSLFGQEWGWEMPTEPPLIPKLAKGGIIKAPTLALVGDNPGANTGDPEVVSPLSKLQGMIDNSSNIYDIQILTQILDYLKKLYELFIVFKNNGGNSYQFVAELNGSTLFDELVYQNELYKKRHNGKSAFA